MSSCQCCESEQCEFESPPITTKIEIVEVEVMVPIKVKHYRNLPNIIVHWETPTLNQIQAALEKEINNA